MHHFPQQGAPRQAWQSDDLMATETPARDPLQDVLRQRREAHEPVEHRTACAQELQRHCGAAECEARGHALARCARDVPALAVAGARCHRGLRGDTTSTRAVGPGRVERRVSRPPPSAPAVWPLARRAGLSDGAWTPLAAQPATWGVAPVPPPEGAARCELWGHRTPAKSPRERLPNARQGPWAAPRPRGAATWRPPAALPPEALAMAGARDGVRTPMPEGQRHATRRHARATGQAPRGPAGEQAVGGATVSSANRPGERLVPRRLARMPEPHHATLQGPLPAEVRGALRPRPAVRVVKGADGAPDPWSYLGETLPVGAEGREGEQAVAPLGEALGAASGAGTPTAQERLEPVRRGLRDASQGVDQVLEARCRLRTRCPRRQAIPKARADFRAPRPRMR